jgi:hypothetical protein
LAYTIEEDTLRIRIGYYDLMAKHDKPVYTGKIVDPTDKTKIIGFVSLWRVKDKEEENVGT